MAAITSEMTIADVLRLNPKVVEVFAKHGMHCIGCQIAFHESVGEAAEVHGVDKDQLIKELNEVVAEK